MGTKVIVYRFRNLSINYKCENEVTERRYLRSLVSVDISTSLGMLKSQS